MNDGDEDVTVHGVVEHNKCLLSKLTAFNQTFRKSKNQQAWLLLVPNESIHADQIM